MTDHARLAAAMAAHITRAGYPAIHLERHALAMGFKLEDYAQ